MSSRGYVYILSNPSMPGLVKVGKTSNNPDTRAKELSGATGVAAPFAVIYSAFFEDASAAESYVHALLDSRGYRSTQNREFFSAELTDVINAVISAPGHIRGGVTEAIEDADEESEGLLSSDEGFLDDFSIEHTRPLSEADKIFLEAERHRHGEDDVFQDYREAVKLLKQAARLGSTEAYHALGELYVLGEGLREDHQEALAYFKEGAKRGNYICYHEIAMIFIMQWGKNRRTDAAKAEQQLQQAEKAWRFFFDAAGKSPEMEFLGTSSFAGSAANYIAAHLHADLPITIHQSLRGRWDEVLHMLGLLADSQDSEIWGRCIDWMTETSTREELR